MSTHLVMGQVRKLNNKPSHKDVNGPKYSHLGLTLTTPAVKTDLRNLCAPIEDQGDLGSCSMFSLGSCDEFLELLELRAKMPPNVGVQEYLANVFCTVSKLFGYYNERAIEGTTDQDAGASTLRDGCLAFAQSGLCTTALWPYQDSLLTVKPNQAAYAEGAKHKLTYFYEIINQAERLHCLTMGFPCTTGIPVYDSFMSDQMAQTGVGVMPGPNETLQGGHAVVIVGYDFTNPANRHYIMRNSWGTGWGMDGYFTLPEDYIEQLGTDFFTLRRAKDYSLTP